jgi:hypothetical protein
MGLRYSPVTNMAKNIEEFWKPLPTNTPLSVAKALLLPATDKSINGKLLLVITEKTARN